MKVTNIQGVNKFTRKVNIDGVNFNNVSCAEGSGQSVKLYIEDNHWWNSESDNEEVSFLGQVNAIDIDWNDAELDENTLIKSTGDLIRIIKEIRETSGSADNAKLTALEEKVNNITTRIGEIVINFVEIDYISKNYVNKENHQSDIDNVKSDFDSKIEAEKTSLTQQLLEITNQLEEIVNTHNSDVENLSSECSANIAKLKEELSDRLNQALENAVEAVNKTDEMKKSIDGLNNSNNLIIKDINSLKTDVNTIKDKYVTKEDVSNSITEAIDGIVDGASDAMNTFKELEDVITNNKDLIETLNEAITKKATKEELETAVEDMATQTWVNDQNFLTEHQSLENYPTRAEVTQQITETLTGGDVSLEGYATTEYVDSKFVNYYDKETIDQKLSEINTDGGSIDLESYATKEYVSEQLQTYETKENAEATYQKKGDYVTTDQLEGYQEKGDYVTSDKLEEYAKVESLDQYVTSEVLEGYVESSVLENYPTKSEVTQQITETLTGGEVSLEGYATEEWVSGNYQAKGNYVTSETLEEYVTSDKLEEYVKVESLDQYVKSSDLEEYATVDQLEDYQPKGEYLTEHQSLADYAKTTEVTEAINNKVTDLNLTQYETIEGAAEKYQPIGEYATTVQLEGYQPKGEYLTEHQDISNLATKEEVNTAKTEAIAKVNELAGTNWAEAGQTVMDIIDELKGDNVSESMVTLVDKLKGLEADTVKEYVDEAIESATIDMATTESVTEAINNKVTDLNLEQYATIDQLEGYQEKGDYVTSDKLEEYVTEESLVAKLQTELAALKEYNEYVNGCNKVTTLINIPTTKRLVVATVNDDETLTLGGIIKEGRELHIVIKNSSDSDITVSININDKEDLMIDANEIGEINIVSDGTNMYVKGITK